MENRMWIFSLALVIPPVFMFRRLSSGPNILLNIVLKNSQPMFFPLGWVTKFLTSKINRQVYNYSFMCFSRYDLDRYRKHWMVSSIPRI
jgi:hypothetical protein